MLAFLDCQARTLGSTGYQAMAAPGSSVSLVLAAALTIFLAIIGYRMLFGETPTPREGVLAFVKMGVVLTLATSWPAYQTFVYDVTMNSPAELAAEIGGAASLVDSEGLAARLDASDEGLRALAIYGVGLPPPSSEQRSLRREPGLFIGFDTFALGASRTIFLASAIGAFALVRLASGFLLALGPLFIAFLLFDGTRGLFEGWLRGLVGLALAGVATTLTLSVELALLEPWLRELLAERASEQDILGVPVQLLTVTLVFGVLLAAMIGVAIRVTAALRLPMPRLQAGEAPRGTAQTPAREIAAVQGGSLQPNEARSRAAATADAILAVQRREEGEAAISRPAAVAAALGTRHQTATSTDIGSTPTRLGQTFNRRVRTRTSASATRRDQR
ncbi:type IV secretion system protein [Sphingomonas sp. DT-204]|uniref:type IV secretion system protein n=1 Tax=Sphingomonas sp. DT-204 TaxID=3396166 RepID=UPI003F19B95B